MRKVQGGASAALGIGVGNVQMTGAIIAAAAAAMVLTAGCGPKSDLFDPGPAPQTTDTGYGDGDWATVLRENVKSGLVDYVHLGSHSEPLDRFLTMAAFVGPKTAPDQFKTPQARLAYYLNAYNAGVLKAVLVAGVPNSMHDVRRLRLEHDYRIRLDGQITTLGDVRESARSQIADDARVELAFCDAARGCPPLFAEPFRAESLDEQLRRVGQDAMGNPQMVTIDHERGKLNVAVVLSQNRERFIDFYRRQTGARSGTMLSALLHLADGARREWLNTAVGYQIGTIPPKRELNGWARAGGGMASR